MDSKLGNNLPKSSVHLHGGIEIQHLQHKPDLNIPCNKEFQGATGFRTFVKQEIVDNYSCASCVKQEEVEVKDEIDDKINYSKNVDNKQDLNDRKDYLHVTMTKQEQTNFSNKNCVNPYLSAPRRGRPRKYLRTQLNEKLFGCTLCGYKCARKAYLNDHMRTHTGDKPYSCTFCDYKCATNSHMTRHLKTHTEDKPYECSLCDFKSTWRECLNNHVRTHAGVKPHCCTFCNYKSVKKCNLVRHLKSHTMEKSYDCSFCDFKCFQKSKFSNHMKIHNSEVPGICELYIKEEFDIENG